MPTLLFAALAVLLSLLPAAADSDLARGLEALRSGETGQARAQLSEIDDVLARDLLHWHLLRNRLGTFAEGEAFLIRNADWPGLDLLRARVELDIPPTTSPARIIAFFAGQSPRTSKGALLLAIALRAEGRHTEAETVAIDAWLSMPMPASSEAGFLEIFDDILRPFDGARLDAMVWSGDLSSAERVLARVSGPEAALARARIALRDGRPGVDTLIEAVPEAFRDHQGLAYERFRWRLDKGRRDDALELLFAYDETADTLGAPVEWGAHRERLARGLMQDGRPEDAYRVAARNHLPDGDRNIAATEWLAGYIALRFLDRPEDAAAHFRIFDANVASPISKGRAGYWLGRALEAAGDLSGAGAAYAQGAQFQTSFYGQLAAARAGLPADPLLTGTEAFPPLAATSFADSTVLAAGRLLNDMGERNLAERFLTHLAESLPRAEIGTLIDVVLDDLKDPHIALLVAKRAAQAGHELHRGYFPLTELAELDSPVAPELALSIARRESEFDPVVTSGAGAAGLMQLMPGTAREMAGLVGLPYRQSALLADPLYNARLGTAYLGELELEFGYSPVLVPAAYNAGPSRARRWSRRFGDPSDPSVDVVDWIEDVPFSETRNYIMRVSESLLPYHARLTGRTDDVPLLEWLKDGYETLVPPGVGTTRGN
ncbi:lytic transglycosylase domain-containing protein [Jannaschia sp. S6380]|uniref:lytic transglycosylase domain-containing protein n=1 Tax=Jannaschia sp. S6380 TaxID=2926408 RepID=UPI001FF18136|nr:lytic transglycosylase domain-containing protein [Jannaschia sp. S6380]MCK0169187.1 lytic transglycosylase domain-containing protein [Jannaschia sp. S6380]